MPEATEYNSSYTGTQIDTAISKVGTGTLNTTATTLIDAVNELYSEKIPSGGALGYFLRKKTATDYDTEWVQKPGMTIVAYGKSTYANVLAAYQNNDIIYCRASSNANPSTGSQLRMAFLAYVNDETTPTEFEFQYYRSIATHSDSNQGDEVYVYKVNSSGTWSVTTRKAYTKVVAGTGLTSSYSSGTITLSNTNAVSYWQYNSSTDSIDLVFPT